MMPIILPLRGMVHKLEKGAKRYVDALSNSNYVTGGFYASKEHKVVGEVVNQFDIFPAMANINYQDNAHKAVHKFIT